MQILNRLYGWYGKRVVLSVGGVTIFLVLVGVFLVFGNKDSDVISQIEEGKPEVTVSAIRALQSTSGFTVVGNVNAVSEAQLQAEAGGRITNVYVAIGDTVPAGKILATIENTSEQAALLQAEGAYESALASSLQSGVSLDEAKRAVHNAYRDTFSTADGVVRNTLDQFFSNPGSPNGGFRLGGSGRAPEFVAARATLETELIEWSRRVMQGANTMTEEQMLMDAESIITTISNFAATIAPILVDEDTSGSIPTEERAGYAAELALARGSLDGALETIARTRETLEQSKLSASSETASQSNAQLKAALGTLRSAQANYEKTLVRTPISGVVNALYMKEGTYATLGAPAALVANNGSLEITTSLGEEDRDIVHIGDTVTINEYATGTVTHIAPAVDPQTGKSEVKISVDEVLSLKNGSTVSVTFTRSTTAPQNDGLVSVPLSALKLLASGPIAFSVNAESTLVARPVELGAITGETVVIANGLTLDDVIVVDARGHKEGDVVTVIQK